LGKRACELVKECTAFEGYFAQNQTTLKALSENVLSRLYESVGLIVIKHHRGKIKGRIVYDRAVDNFQSACKRAGIPEGQFTDANGKARRPGFHELRRTFARMMFRAGVPMHEIQRIVGWKTMVMVARYVGDSEHGTRQALETADKVF